MNAITNFRDPPYDFLGNWYPCLIYYKGLDYASVEHAYQAAKTNDIELKAQIRSARTPVEAMKLGKKLPEDKLVKDFDKLAVMESIVYRKFTQNDELREMLLNTGELALINLNPYNDIYWGAKAIPSCVGELWCGDDHLGKILTRIRNEIQG